MRGHMTISYCFPRYNINATWLYAFFVSERRLFPWELETARKQKQKEMVQDDEAKTSIVQKSVKVVSQLSYRKNT